MVTRQKKSLYKLTEMLRLLEKNPHDYALLLRLQRALVAVIKRSDQRIAELKQRKCTLIQERKNGRHSKASSQALKGQIASVTEVICDAQQLLFFWRCFGDGIAFIYLDKYALKHMLYNTHDYGVKQSAGALSGKRGFKFEWARVRSLAKKQVPSILCDITNTLRHGDVCVLIGPDPMLIEVKSSTNRNTRVDRQIANLAALHKFLETDEATDFRGLDRVKRMEFPLSGVSHTSVMNECIKQSRATGFAAISPEDGLTYACFRSPQAVEYFDAHMGPERMVTLLNEAKNEAGWMPYYPFTLSIREPEALHEFINGDITLAVILDTQALVRQFAAKGLQAQFVEHPTCILLVSRLGAVCGQDPFSAISIAFFGRLFYEFEPIRQMADSELHHIQQLESSSREIQLKIDSGELKAEDIKAKQWPEFKPMRWPNPSA